ncbi:hypothetical protein FIBSPDRAFT_863336 [Athelia psychrophila]|uniref:Uncharacterized protein n=1 Tax=Athelia psychrophila TaxID=1759441 RepID=A0A166HEA2_9AGAM|nr:hypothetical protein FIBSPDRAFT_863336 [Fibularhizoctonia sp. CBS 109695]
MDPFLVGNLISLSSDKYATRHYLLPSNATQPPSLSLDRAAAQQEVVRTVGVAYVLPPTAFMSASRTWLVTARWIYVGVPVS